MSGDTRTPSRAVARLAWGLSLAIGFLSLSQEILWVRVVALGTQARPEGFSLVLFVFLLGIALGAIAGRRLCARSPDLPRATAAVLLAAAAADLLALRLVASPLALTPQSPELLGVTLTLVALRAALKGTLFPVVHHLGTVAEDDRIGRAVSKVYVANVLGATLGPIVTGFWLLDVLPLAVVMAGVALATALLAALTLAVAHRQPAAQGAPRGLALGVAAVLAVSLAWVAQPLGVVAQIVADDAPQRLRQVGENRHGVLHVMAEDSAGSGDITFGGNAYDGRISTDLRVNANGLDRAYLLATLHPAPRRALVVGLSTGAWATVILGMPGIEALDVVEINPGYVDLIRRYPAVAPLLADPRLRLNVDDGRRWLRAHPGERYDLVFQNTTWHWRANTTLLLSQDYLRQLQQHLNPGGIVAMNTTGSLDVYHTAGTVFAHVVRYRNFVYMSDAPLQQRPDAAALLRACRIWQAPAFTEAAFAPDGVAGKLLAAPLMPGAAYVAQEAGGRAPRVITDLNLVPEYRHGSGLALPALQPLLPADAGPWAGPRR